MKNVPEIIYLQVGDLSEDVLDEVNFHDLDEVTWCEDQVSDTAIKFVRPDSLQGQLEVLRQVEKTYSHHSLENVIRQLESVQKERSNKD